MINVVNRSGAGRKLLDLTLGVHPQARIPEYRSNTLRKRLKGQVGRRSEGEVAGPTTVARSPCSPPATTMSTSRLWA